MVKHLSVPVISHHKSTFSYLKSVGKVYTQEGACLCVSSSAQGQNTISSKSQKSLHHLSIWKATTTIRSTCVRWTKSLASGSALLHHPGRTAMNCSPWSHTEPMNTDPESVVYNSGKKYLFLKSFTPPCINSSRSSGMGFPYSQLSSHLQETLIPCDSLGLGGNNHGFFCATLAMTKHPCLCTVRDPCQPSCRLQLVNSLGAAGNTPPPGLKQNNPKKPTTPTE